MAGLPTLPLPAPVFAAAIALALPLSKRRNLGNFSNPSVHHPSAYSQPVWCRLCNGQTFIPCRVCNQTGTLGPGGFSKRNTVRVDALVGTKWTSVTAIGGKWRHFLCVAKKGRGVKDGVAVLSSTCGPVQNRITVNVPVKELKSREIWTGGWTTLKDIGNGLAATVCTACKGQRKVVCPRCDGLGQVGL